MCGRVRLSSDYSEIKIRLRFAPNSAANLRHRKSWEIHSRCNEQNIPRLHKALQFEIAFNATGSLHQTAGPVAQPMSAYGTKRTFNCRPAMSALGVKADIGRAAG